MPEYLTWWTGWDRPKSVSVQSDDANRTFAQAPQADTMIEHNYELLAVTGRGFRPPRFLRSHDLLADEAVNLHRDDSPDLTAGLEGLVATWSVLYRRMSETQPEEVTPYAIYLLGVNPPPTTTIEDLEAFNDFYTNVHLPEVAERRRALRAQRYELVSEPRPPYLGAPRFLTTYEVDQESASNRRHIGPPYSTGPDVWQRHKTPWRLWYRRLTTESH